ncbi:MAG: glycosyltransferase [Bacteroidales bacterium]|nr:glycosyltransferase [Bacteroidales bacterium]
MKVSIVTICYNNEKEIRATIESVLSQTHPDIEYIVVDGASKDNSLSIINEYKDRIAVIISEPDHGMYEALDKGFQRATGDVIGMIHSGDRLHDENVIADIAKFYETHDVDMTYGHSRIVNAQDVAQRINKSPEYSMGLIRRGWMPSHQSIYCKKKVFDLCGYYRNDLGGGGDYEWFIRSFYKHGKELKIARVDRFVVKFALGGQSTYNYSHKLSKKHFDYVKRCWQLNELKPPCGIVYWMFSRKVKQFVLAKLSK